MGLDPDFEQLIRDEQNQDEQSYLFVVHSRRIICRKNSKKSLFYGVPSDFTRPADNYIPRTGLSAGNGGRTESLVAESGYGRARIMHLVGCY